MTDTSPRLALPLLAAGQAQKELFHNEALAILDALVQPVVQSCGVNDPPVTPATGESWIVGSTPTGAWLGHAHCIATWTDGGWRFVAPVEGMTLWVADENLFALHASGAWTVGTVPAASVQIGGQQVVGARQSAISSPASGAVIDTEARAVLADILVALRTHGLINP